MKVLVVTTHPVPYGARAWTEWSSLHGHELTVAFSSLGGATRAYDEEFSTHYQWAATITSGYRWLWLGGGSNRTTAATGSHRNVVNVVRLIRRGGFDLVVCLGYRRPLFIASLLTARATGAMVAVGTDAHNDLALADDVRSRVRGAVRRLLVPRIYRRLDAVFVSSERGRSYHCGLGLDSNRVMIVRNVVDTDFFGFPRSAVNAVRAELGVEAAALVVLFAGKLVPRKRPGDVLLAVAMVPRTHAIIAGSGELRDELLALADELKISERVSFVGFRPPEELAVLYQAADVLVLPSSVEPFGLVACESFAAGTPAVVSDACGVAGEIVRPGVTGFTYRSGDVAELVRALDKLHSGELRAELGREARLLIQNWRPSAGAHDLANALTVLSRSRVGRLSDV